MNYTTTLNATESLLVEHYVDFLVALVEYGNMPNSTWEQEPHHFRLMTGCEDEEFNAIFSLEEPIHDPMKIKQNLERMGEHALPFTWVIPDNDNFRYMESLLSLQGLEKQAASQGMIGKPSALIDPPSHVRVLEVRNEHQLDLWLDLYEKSFFGEPAPLIKQLFRKALLEAGLNDSSPLQADIAFIEDVPVGCNLLFYSHERSVGGFWCTGVLPAARGQGVAKALVNYRMLDLMQKGVPQTATWLDQNGTLFPLFTRLGMETQLKLTCFSGSTR